MVRQILLLISFLVFGNLECVLCLDFSKAKTLIHDASNLIYRRFEFDRKVNYQFFLEVSNMPPYGWDMQKYKIAKKIVDGGNSSYLMIFGGSSVTAGHDNYYHQSHPFVFERRISPILEATGVKLIVRNIAQGANNCRPFAYCYESMGGERADFISWEQSFNCGRDRGVFEYMARVAYWSHSVLYYMASGGWIPNCPASTEKPARIEEIWTPEASGITEKIPEPTRESVAAYRDLIENWNGDGNSCSKFSSYYGGLYKAVAPWGFNFWAHSSKLCNDGKGCDAVSMIGECAAAGGPKWITAEGSYYAGEEGKHGKNWHPPAGMHLLRGEVLAYNYLQMIIDAIFMIEDDLQTKTPEQASLAYQAKLDELREPIPENALYLPEDESNNPPQCFTSFTPHFNPAQTLERAIMGSLPPEGWRLVPMQTWSDGDRKYGYQDTKPYYEDTGAGKGLSFKLLNVRSGSVRVCGYSKKEALKHAVYDIDPDYEFPDTSIGELLPAYVPTTRVYRHTNLNEAGDECVRLTDVPKGNAVLTVRTDPAVPNYSTAVSHIIVF